MKEMIKNVLLWSMGALCILMALGCGSLISALLLLAAAFLFLPIRKIRGFLNEKLRIKNLYIIISAVVLLFVGVGISPVAETKPKEKEPTITQTETEEISENTKETANKEPFQETAETEKNTEVPDSKDESNQGENSTSVTPNKDNLSTNAVQSSSIPAYSGSPWTAVNDNKPFFTSSEITVIAFEKYSELDYLGRCGVAFACCGKEIMPRTDEERGSISSIKPSGWVQAQYDNISGKYLYNRCHLIGWQLSAENANKKNLITGTKYINVEGMLPFENMIADYIKETGNHVMYRVTPIYQGNNLVASGVQLEAYSVEDGGEGICFNVYCYNVQPGISIDYATGKSLLEGQSIPSVPNAPPVTTAHTHSFAAATCTAPRTCTVCGAVEGSAAGHQYLNGVCAVCGSSDPNYVSEQMVWIPQSGSGDKYHSKATCGNMKKSLQLTLSEAVRRGHDTPCSNCH